MSNSNSSLSPKETLPIAQENKYLGSYEYFVMKMRVVCTHSNPFIEAILEVHSTYHYCIEDGNDIPKLSPLVSWSGAMINLQ